MMGKGVLSFNMLEWATILAQGQATGPQVIVNGSCTQHEPLFNLEQATNDYTGIELNPVGTILVIETID